MIFLNDRVESLALMLLSVNIMSIVAIETNKNLVIAKNLRILLNENKLSENDLAQALNFPVMTIRRLVSGETTDPRISTLKLIADYFHISVDSLVEDNHSTPTLMSKCMPQFIPVLDWKTITTIHSIAEIDIKSWKDWHPIALSDKYALSKMAYALESKPSMQPRYPLGTLFIIDPDESPNDGDIVLIKMKQNGEVSLRELIIDLPRWQLQPLVAGSETFFFDTTLHDIAGIVIFTILHTRAY